MGGIAALVIAGGGVGVGIASTDEDTGATTSDPGSSDTGGDDDAALLDETEASNEDKAKAKKANLAKVGDALALDGTDTKMRVTVLKVIDPVAGGEIDEADAGNRFIGVQIKLENVGGTIYDDAPSNGAELLMSDDSQAEGAILTGGSCTSNFGSSAKVSPGSVQQGCIPFEAKQGLAPKTFQFSLDSGFGPQSGEWQITSTTPGSASSSQFSDRLRGQFGQQPTSREDA